MKRIKTLVIILILIAGNQLIAQDLVFKYAKQLSSFSFVDSDATTLENLLTGSSDMQTMAYRTCLYKNVLNASFGLSLSDYNAIGSDDSVHNFMEWNTTYLGGFIDIDAQVFKVKDFSFYINTGFSAEYLIAGNQTLNDKVFNLTATDDYNNLAYFYKGGASMSYPISKTTQILVQYQAGKSLNISNNANEKFYITTHQLAMGVKINLNIKTKENEK